MKNSVLILWLEGIDPASLTSLPSLARLAASGVDLRLTPLPLAEKSVCYYQTLTGMGSGKIGQFDAVRPEEYQACEETTIPEGVRGRLFPDILRSQKLSSSFLETKDTAGVNSLLDRPCDCTVARLLDMESTNLVEIDAIVQRWTEEAAPGSHVVVLTSVWRPAPGKLVNINDFLAEVGLLGIGTIRNRAAVLWTETLAYGLGTGQVWINLRGREPQGIVGSGYEYQQVCEALAKELHTSWLDPRTNEPVVEQVLRKEDIFAGEYLFKAPDLAVVYRPGYAASPKARVLDFDGRSICEANPGGSAVASNAIAPYARLIASGPCLENGFTGTATLVDVVPNVLYLLGLPIPMHIDGHVISSLFTYAYRQRTPVRHLESDANLLSDEETDMIVDRLRDLGYLG